MTVNTKATKKLGKHAEVKNLTGLMIRQFREKRGWTQYQLADSFRKMGVLITRCIIANIETQRCPVTDCQLLCFARVLGVSWASLFPDKTTLDKFMPRLATKNLGLTGKKKHPRNNLRSKPSQKRWSICEMTCKSVKITIHAPS